MKARLPQGYGKQNVNQLMQQAQKLQEDMKAKQEEMEAASHTVTAGGGMVRAKVNGEREILELEIKPEAVDPDDVEMLQDMIMAALNEALKTAHETVENEMSKLTGGVGGGFGGLL